MGFGTIVANIVMFIAVLTVSTSVFVLMKNNIAEQNSAMVEQSKYLSNNLKTSVEIENLAYDNETNVTTLNVRNTGKTKLSLDYVDVYIGSEFIPRSDNNRSISVDSSTDTKNPGIWDTNEVVEIQVPKDLETGEYDIRVAVQYGVYAEDTFSVAYG